MTYILKTLLKIKSLLSFLAEALSALSNGQIRGIRGTLSSHGWFVCPTLSMVTTSHATGLEKTLLRENRKKGNNLCIEC